jgi:hypothetical protein
VATAGAVSECSASHTPAAGAIAGAAGLFSFFLVLQRFLSDNAFLTLAPLS